MTYPVRQFDKADCLAVQGIEMDAGPATGFTFVDEAEAVVGYVGLYLVNGRDWLFFWWKRDVPRPAAQLHRVAKAFMRGMRGTVTEVYTICDNAYGIDAAKWMTRLGFSPLAEDEKDFEIKHYEDQQRGGAHKLWLGGA